MRPVSRKANRTKSLRRVNPWKKIATKVSCDYINDCISARGSSLSNLLLCEGGGFLTAKARADFGKIISQWEEADRSVHSHS